MFVKENEFLYLFCSEYQVITSSGSIVTTSGQIYQPTIYTLSNLKFRFSSHPFIHHQIFSLDFLPTHLYIIKPLVQIFFPTIYTSLNLQFRFSYQPYINIIKSLVYIFFLTIYTLSNLQFRFSSQPYIHYQTLSLDFHPNHIYIIKP